MMLEVSLQHRFGDFALDVAFRAPAGLTALFGASGSGKTTVINAIAGLQKVDHARVILNGIALHDLPAHRRRIAYVFQDARLFPHLSVLGNLRYGSWFRPKGAQDEAAVVDLLGLSALLQRQPSALSGGEKQRVAIGRALLSDPQLLAMDEPLSALDHARKAEILPYLERLRDEAGLPILYVSHALPEVARLANSIVVIEEGRVLRSAPAADVMADPNLSAILGLRDAGSLISAHLVAQEADGLTRLETFGGPLFLPHLSTPVGAVVRLRIPAQDVMISLSRPEAISALNILAVTIDSVTDKAGSGAVLSLRLGDEKL
ncbi:MAG: molybdenum ABC transporter ATP-binding protein, partial [Rhodobacteraceae bacterium]|nr:molybdenum ABC transporter ATP-binding protein [Paracoccaceae bacterium]